MYSRFIPYLFLVTSNNDRLKTQTTRLEPSQPAYNNDNNNNNNDNDNNNDNNKNYSMYTKYKYEYDNM